MLRKQSNISDYLCAYKVECVSESYYRDLESGRRVLRIETGGNLADQLDLDKTLLYRHLLKDVLPEATFKELGLDNKDLDHSFSAVEGELVKKTEELAKERGVKEVALRALARNMGDSEMEIDDETVSELNEKFDILPVIHFLYLRNSCSFDSIESVLRNNKALLTLENVITFLERKNLAEIDRANKVVRRHLPVFRVPRTRTGLAFKNRFLLEEVKKSIIKPRGTSVTAETTWISSSIVCLVPGEAAGLIEEKLGELSSILTKHEKNLDDEGAIPYFVAVVLSPREEYDSGRKTARATKEKKREMP